MINSATNSQSNKQKSKSKAAKLEEEKTKKIDATQAPRAKRKYSSKKDASGPLNHLNIYH